MLRLIFLLLLFFHVPLRAATLQMEGKDTLFRDCKIISDSSAALETEWPYGDTAGTFRRDKIISAALAFPLPFGFMGLHRIYMGGEPWVPVVYLVTAGGGFGILPLMDFIFILTANEAQYKEYCNNPHLFMWVK